MIIAIIAIYVFVSLDVSETQPVLSTSSCGIFLARKTSLLTLSGDN